MFDDWKRQHTKTFPKVVKVWRRLQNGMDIVDYQGLYEKVIDKTDDGSIESRSLWLRRPLKRALGKNIIACLLGMAVGAFAGWLFGVIASLLFPLPLIGLILMIVFALIGAVIGWTMGNDVELFVIPAPPQGAYMDGNGPNTGKDVIWFLQTGLNDFHPLMYREGAFVATIIDKIPIFNWYEQKDAEGKTILGADGKPALQKGEIAKYEEHPRQVVLFDSNFYLTGDKDNPTALPVPYVVAYKSSDTFQWLLMQAERIARFYRKGGFWEKYGNMVAMVMAGLFIVIILVVGLQQYAAISHDTAIAFGKVGEQIQANNGALSQIANAIQATKGTPVPPA